MTTRKDFLERLERDLQKNCDNMSQKIDECLDISDNRAAALLHMAQLKTWESMDKAERLDDGRPTDVVTSVDMIRLKVGNTLDKLDFLDEEDGKLCDGGTISGLIGTGSTEANGDESQALSNILSPEES